MLENASALCVSMASDAVTRQLYLRLSASVTNGNDANTIPHVKLGLITYLLLSDYRISDIAIVLCE